MNYLNRILKKFESQESKLPRRGKGNVSIVLTFMLWELSVMRFNWSVYWEKNLMQQSKFQYWLAAPIE